MGPGAPASALPSIPSVSHLPERGRVVCAPFASGPEPVSSSP
jgi:hypothetical protein